jgi:hypothetical protein
MLSSHKKKLVRQKSIHVPSPPPSLQSPFTWENNLNWNIQTSYPDPLIRSFSTESSTSRSSSSKPVVVVSNKFSYQRR